MHKLQKQIDYWRKSGLDDWKTAEYLLEGKRYDACLFFLIWQLKNCSKEWWLWKQTRLHHTSMT